MYTLSKKKIHLNRYNERGMREPQKNRYASNWEFPPFFKGGELDCEVVDKDILCNSVVSVSMFYRKYVNTFLKNKLLNEWINKRKNEMTNIRFLYCSRYNRNQRQMESRRNAYPNERPEKTESRENREIPERCERSAKLGKQGNHGNLGNLGTRQNTQRGEHRRHLLYLEKEIGRGTGRGKEIGRGRWGRREETSRRRSMTEGIPYCSLPSTISDRALSKYLH